MVKKPSNKLAQLLAAAKSPPEGANPEQTQDAFFKALLDATVYAHVPLGNPPEGVMRFIQFVRPDNGQTMLPFFSDKQQAEASRRNAALVVAMSGRNLFELTRGASLMLNPNVDAIALYPPEIAAILEGRALDYFAKDHIPAGTKVQIVPPSVSTAELNTVLRNLFETEATVKAAFLAEVRRLDEGAEVILVLTVVVAKTYQERLLQLVTLAFKAQALKLDLPLDIHFLVPDEPRNDLCNGGVQIFGT
jgi:hypothetical protein